jgi:hypothetical protein
MMAITGRFTNTLKPFSVTFQPLLNQIENKEKTLKQLATMATMEGVKGEHTTNQTGSQEEDLMILLDRHPAKDQHCRRNEGTVRPDIRRKSFELA